VTNDNRSRRIIVLCVRLANATFAGHVRWEMTNEDTFSWRRPEGGVEITSRDRDGMPPFALSVYSANGQKVDELASELAANDEPAPWNDALATLYRAARSSGLRADEIVDALIAALPTPQREQAPTPAASVPERAT
jgi:hypothetical protein